jgi:hypothetical protein
MGLQCESSSQGPRLQDAGRIRQPCRGSPRHGYNLNKLKTNPQPGTAFSSPSRLSELRDKRAALTPHWYKRAGNPSRCAYNLARPLSRRLAVVAVSHGKLLHSARNERLRYFAVAGPRVGHPLRICHRAKGSPVHRPEGNTSAGSEILGLVRWISLCLSMLTADRCLLAQAFQQLCNAASLSDRAAKRQHFSAALRMLQKVGPVLHHPGAHGCTQR